MNNPPTPIVSGSYRVQEDGSLVSESEPQQAPKPKSEPKVGPKASVPQKSKE